MQRHQNRSANHSMYYNENTEPVLPPITTPMPRVTLPHESWIRRAFRGIGAFFSANIRKVNQLLALALAVLLLLLFTRFVLDFFNFSSSGSPFSYWVYYLSTPLVAPFRSNLLPSLPSNGFTIVVSTLIAIVAYASGATIVRQFLKVLSPR